MDGAEWDGFKWDWARCSVVGWDGMGVGWGGGEMGRCGVGVVSRIGGA